ncbi:hypothetical protein GGQ84_002304 [Desulfitispora alkaliphila]|uniref:copper transporter n=1 Tax=Desulfitispora alkaliphila TaxID=622674 RepID=UPI003D2507F5
MFNFKYHITSLVAVFLALGIGVLVGSALDGEGVMLEQQKVLIDRLEEDFYKIREENRAYQAEIQNMSSMLDLYNNFAEEVLPSIVEGKIEGINLAIIKTNERDLPSGLMTALKLSGANLNLITTVQTLEELEKRSGFLESRAEELDLVILLRGEEYYGDASPEIEARLTSIYRDVSVPVVGATWGNDIAWTVERGKNIDLKSVTGNVETPMGMTTLISEIASLAKESKSD